MTFNQIAQQTLDIVKSTVPSVYRKLYEFYTSDKVSTEYITISWGVDAKKRPVLKLKEARIRQFVTSVLEGFDIARGVAIYINPVNRLAFIDYTNPAKGVPQELMTQSGLVFDDIQYSIVGLDQIEELRRVDAQLTRLADDETDKKETLRLEALQAAYIFDELYSNLNSKDFMEKKSKQVKVKGSPLTVYKKIKVTSNKEGSEKQIVVNSMEEAEREITTRLAGAEHARADFITKVSGRREIVDDKLKVYVVNKLNQKLTGLVPKYLSEATLEYAPFSDKFPKLYIKVDDPNITGIYYAGAATGVYSAMDDYERWLASIQKHNPKLRSVGGITTVPVKAQELRVTDNYPRGFSKLETSPNMTGSTTPLQISVPETTNLPGFSMPDVNFLPLDDSRTRSVSPVRTRTRSVSPVRDVSPVRTRTRSVSPVEGRGSGIERIRTRSASPVEGRNLPLPAPSGMNLPTPLPAPSGMNLPRPSGQAIPLSSLPGTMNLPPGFQPGITGTSLPPVELVTTTQQQRIMSESDVDRSTNSRSPSMNRSNSRSPGMQTRDMSFSGSESITQGNSGSQQASRSFSPTISTSQSRE